MIEIIVCFTKGLDNCPTYNNAIKVGVGIAVLAFMGLFVLFTFCMFIDQIKMKLENTSTIDRLQKNNNRIQQ